MDSTQRVPADRVATSRGPLGIEQPFVGFDEWPTLSAAVPGERQLLLIDDTCPVLYHYEFEVPLPTVLYDVFCMKYGWPIGPTEIWAEVSPEFRGWLATKVSFALDVSVDKM